MASVNKVILVGNLGKDPETRYMPEGGAITNITLATTPTWKDKEGNDRYTTEIVADSMQLLGSKRDSGGDSGGMREPPSESSRSEAPSKPAAKKPAGQINDMDDDIPF